MLLNFCLGCKKKKIASESDHLGENVSLQDSGQPKSSANCKSANCKSGKAKSFGKLNKTKANKSTNKNAFKGDQVDYPTPTSPPANCKYTDKLNENSLQTPIHSVTNDGSVRIKSNAINRALPDIPIGDLANTSLNSTANAVNRSIDRPSLDRSLTPPTSQPLNQQPLNQQLNQTLNLFNITLNLPSHPLNQSNHSAHSNSLSVNESTKFACLPGTSTFNPAAHNLHHASLNSSLHSNSCLPDLDSQTDLNEVLNKSDQRHHSYARIKDNEVIDSSTENDTDDYYDSTIVAKRGLDLQKDRVTINVPSATNHLNSQMNVANQPSGQLTTINDPNSSLYAVSSNLTRITNLELPYHISTINDVTANTNFINNVYDLSADEEPAKEVSYNKISVREPLAKVLADRAALMEHHYYTEVYDENSSFYEEIAGSTNSSVTYTKIGELTGGQTAGTSHISPPTTSSPLIPVETSVLTIKHPSRTTSPMQAMPVLQTFLPASNLMNANLPDTQSGAFASTSSQPPINCEALYTQVNKLAKTNKKYLASQPPLPPNVNDLYAKVQKNLKLQSLDQDRKMNESGTSSGISIRKIHSSTPDVQNASLNSLGGSVKKRPPLPPPLDNIPKNPKSSHSFPIKSNTNLSHPEPSAGYANQFGLNVYPPHRRSLSSGGQYQDTDSDYDTFPPHRQLPDDHNYEKVKKKISSGGQLNDDDKEIVEAEYECIKPVGAQGSSDEDTDSPCYETIETKLTDEYVSEPDYETITNVSKPPPFNRLSRTESDASADPGYERIRQDYDQKIDEINEANRGYEPMYRENFVERL